MESENKILKLAKEIKQFKFAEWEAVTSTNIKYVLYEEDIEVLTVIFQDDSEFEYDNVPLELYEDMLDASSIGSFFYWNIREFPDLYPFVKVS